MNIRRYLNRKQLNDSGVSPVIATILMVAITVILATVLYLIISGLITTPKDVPKATASVSLAGDNYYRVTGFTLTKEYPFDDNLRYSLQSSIGNPILQGLEGDETSVLIRNVYNVNLEFFDGINGYDVSFNDAQPDQKLNTGDSFFIRASVVSTGDIFIVSYRANPLIEVTIP